MDAEAELILMEEEEMKEAQEHHHMHHDNGMAAGHIVVSGAQAVAAGLPSDDGRLGANGPSAGAGSNTN